MPKTFFDGFDRVDSTTVGGEWTSENDSSGKLSIADGKLRVSHTSTSQSVITKTGLMGQNLWIEFDVVLSEVLNLGNGASLVPVYALQGGSIIAGLRFLCNTSGSVFTMQFVYRNNANSLTYVSLDTSWNPAANTTYTVEIKVVPSVSAIANNGSVEIWIDGLIKLSKYDLQNFTYRRWNTLWLGMYSSSLTSTTLNVDFDNFSFGKYKHGSENDIIHVDRLSVKNYSGDYDASTKLGGGTDGDLYVDIMDALECFDSGDVIYLRYGLPHIISRDVSVGAKNLTLAGKSYEPGNAILDFNGSSYKIIFNDAACDGSSVRNLIFKNASYASSVSTSGPITAIDCGVSLYDILAIENATGINMNNACVYALLDNGTRAFLTTIENSNFSKNTVGVNDGSDCRNSAIILLYAENETSNKPTVNGCVFGGSSDDKNILRGRGNTQDIGCLQYRGHSNPIVKNTEFSHNEIDCVFWGAPLLSSGYGGGSIKDCTFSYNNVVYGGGCGAAVKFSHQHGPAELKRSTISYNQSMADAHDSPAILCEYCLGGVNAGDWITIDLCKFIGNTTGEQYPGTGHDSSGALMVYRGSGVMLSRTEFIDNSNYGSNGSGGLHVHAGWTNGYGEYPGQPRTMTTCYASMCIFIRNAIGGGLDGSGGAACTSFLNEDSYLIISQSLFYGNSSSNTNNKSSDLLTEAPQGDGSVTLAVESSIIYSDPTPGILNGAGSVLSVAGNNILRHSYGAVTESDPKFVNPATGNFHIQPDSPCIGTGTKISGIATDIENNPIFPPYNIGPFGLEAGALGVAPVANDGAPRNNITRLTGAATIINPTDTYELSDTNAWRVVTGWTAGVANDFFDANGVPIPFSGQKLIDAGIGPQLYCGLRGIAGYTVDQDAATNAKIIKILKVPTYIDTLYWADSAEMDWSASNE